MICKECGAQVKPSFIHFAISFNVMMIISLVLGFFGTDLFFGVPIYSLNEIEPISEALKLIFASFLGILIPILLGVIYFALFVPLQIDENT